MSKLEVLFLGTGNAFHSDGKANQAVIIRGDSFTWCIDAGPTLLYQLGKYGIDPAAIGRLFLTHFHGDHMAGIPFFVLYLYEFAGTHYTVAIHGPAGTRKHCRKHYAACYPEIGLDAHARYHEFPLKHKAGIALEEKAVLELFPMVHRPESLGYKFTIRGITVAITGDTKWNPNIPLLARGSDLVIIECTTMQRSVYAHISFEEFAAHLDSLDAKLIVPVHLTGEIACAFKKLKHPKIRIVEDGDIIRFPGLTY